MRDFPSNRSGGLMRLFIIGAALLFTTTAASAQSRWTLSAGPEWTPNFGGFIGGRVRGEYDLIRPTKPFRLRMELGGYWEPSQNFDGRYVDGSTVAGYKQSMDLMFGLSAAVTPVPRARVAPYLTFGVLARQSWKHGSTWFWPAGGGTGRVYSTAGTMGDIVFPVGLGVRASIASRMFQVEIRRFQGQQTSALMIGTSLPF